jgi:hypothetical protein
MSSGTGTILLPLEAVSEVVGYRALVASGAFAGRKARGAMFEPSLKYGMLREIKVPPSVGKWVGEGGKELSEAWHIDTR